MQKAVEIKSKGLTLRGMLHIPEGHAPKYPVVLIFHGFTGNKMEPHFIFVKLSRLLEKHGIASLRFDFGGSGESDGDFVDMTISAELEDAKAILDYAKTLDFADMARIGVVGLSMGGTVASMLAGDRHEDISTLCLWAPAGDMLERIAGRIGVLKEQDVVDVDGLLLGAGFVRDAAALDVFGKAAEYDKNVLILQGNNDAAVPLSVAEQYLEIYEKKAVLHIIEGGDHTFNKKEFEEEVLEFTVAFLKEELAVKKL